MHILFHAALPLALLTLTFVVILEFLRAKRRRAARHPSHAPPSTDGTGWSESYIDGSQFAETEFIKQSLTDIHLVQTRNKKNGHASTIKRAFHAKLLAGITNAEFVIADDIPVALQVSFLQPGKRYRTAVRFSNASGVVQADTKNDLRGLAYRVVTESGLAHDFLLTNGPVNHVRDSRQFMQFAKAGSGKKILMIPKLLYYFGIIETIRILRTVISQVKRPVESLALEQFWSRAPYAFGNTALKFTVVRSSSATEQLNQLAQEHFTLGMPRTDNYLSEDLIERLKHGPVVYDFQVQLWTDTFNTPLEDASVAWNSPFVTIAQLVLPQQDLTTDTARQAQESVEKMEFNPWNTTPEFCPARQS